MISKLLLGYILVTSNSGGEEFCKYGGCDSLVVNVESEITLQTVCYLPILYSARKTINQGKKKENQ